jgi:YidC/Oxa1 family membrane protein insertase
LLSLCCAAPALAQYTLETDNLQLAFAENGDLLQATACLPDCASVEAHRHAFGDPLLAFTSFATEAFTLTPRVVDDVTELLFEGESAGSRRLWRNPANGFALQLETRGAERLDLAASAGLRSPPGAAGFGLWLEQSRYLLLEDRAVEQIGLDEPPADVVTSDWSGFRNRFWAVLVKPQTPLPLQFAATVSDPALVLATDPGQLSTLSLYLGPIEPQALHNADPELENLMYAGLWFWLRWICQGLYWLLGVIHALVPHWAAAIVLLSVAVGILMRPLSRIADRLQDQVQRTEATLAPDLAQIKRDYKGAEQSEQMIALYKKHGVHPLYSLKSLAGVAVIIPVFIGAFDMLAENIWLAEQSWWWIRDLARPDALAALPFTLPFFGGQFNALPFIMTGFSVLASSLHRHEAMTPAALRKHRINLALMALAFLALFYTFPAGMVLYWTTNNALSVIKYAWRNWRGQRKEAATP